MRNTKPRRLTNDADLTENHGQCCWPGCENEAGRFNLPLCDSHTVDTWRAVHAEMSIRAERDYGKPSRSGTIYCLRFGNRLKIGWTANLPQRLRNLPHEEILGTVVGTVIDERRLHDVFAHLRLTGEWFQDDPEIRALVGQWQLGG